MFKKSFSEHSPDDSIAFQEVILRKKIAKLQALERRQRLIEDLKRPKRKIRGISFASAFLIVLGLHLSVAGGIYGFSALKKSRTADKLALSKPVPPPVYTGVPEASAKSLNADSTSPDSVVPLVHKTTEIANNKGHITSASPTEKKRLDHQPSSHTDLQRTSLKPSPSIRALFSHGHFVGKQDEMAAQEAEKPIHEPLVATPHPSPSHPSHYTVGPGDTLPKVAAMMGIPASSIMAANGMESGSSLRVGKRLTIPDSEKNPPLQLVNKDPEVSTEKSDLPETFTPKRERIAPNGIYMVQRGDNPYMVARKLGVSFTDLMMANTISNPADVTVGMRLKVPQSRLASN